MRWRRLDPERKDSIDTVRLWLEGIRVERRHVVIDIEVMNPVQVMVHETGSKTTSAPIIQIAVDTFSVCPKSFLGAIKLPIMLQIVHANLEAVIAELLAQFLRNAVFPFGNEIEARAKSPFRFESSEPVTSLHTFPALDIMRQNKRELFSGRPSGPARR